MITLFFVLFIFFSSLIVFAWFAKDLPNPDKIVRREGFSTIIYDREGNPLYDVYSDENRKPISFEDIPEDLKNATIAIEDKSFYTHEGYSTTGILRSIIKLIISGKIQGGGSTLTQQLVKNVLLTSERTLPRKIKEFILAVQIERKYTKDEILTMYLNEAPYGGTAWGVEAAANLYFGKSAKDLTLLESAILAGLPQSPSVYSPYSQSKDAYIGRTKQVLRRMREDGYISRDTEEKLINQLPNVSFAGKEKSFKAPHFVEYVKKQLIDEFGEEVVGGGGLRVTTTLDLQLQNKAEQIVKDEIDSLKNLHVSNGALVAIDPNNGEILAMVGSKNYYSDAILEGKFNVAVQGLRQPGSALKPILYATAFEEGYTPASLIMDVLTKFPGGTENKFYEPKNYDGKYRGPVQMRFALANSINIPAVKTLALVGLEDFLDNAYRFGLSTLEPTKENMKRFGLSIALGGGEVTLLDLTKSYSVFANGGVVHELVSIEKVTDKNGKILFKNRKTKGKRVISEEIAFLISHILSDNNARSLVFGPNSWLNIPGKTVAVKTGTTDDKRDNWTVGYTKSIVIGVWVGNNDNSPMNQKLASGVTGASPIWHKVMVEALNEGKSDGIIEKPSDVIAMQIDALGGGLPKEGQQIRSEYFIKGTEPTEISPIYQKVKISREHPDKLANDEEIAHGDYEERDYIVFSEDDPLSKDTNYWQEGIWAWVEGQDNPLYKVPHEISTRTYEDKKEEQTPTPTPTPTISVSPTVSPTLSPTLSPTPSL